MNKGNINTGDKIGEWTVNKRISGDKVYEVSRKDSNQPYAMKIRRNSELRRFDREIEILKKLNRDGGHPAFPQLHDYSRRDYWMVLDYANPDHKLKDVFEGFKRSELLVGINIDTFTEQLRDAIVFALNRGLVLLSSDMQLFIKDGKPFLVDVEHAQKINTSPQQWMFGYIATHRSKTPLEAFLNLSKHKEFISSLNSDNQ